jgi:hypothetical protein
MLTRRDGLSEGKTGFPPAREHEFTRWDTFHFASLSGRTQDFAVQ